MTQTLHGLSDDIASVARSLQPSLVRVLGGRRSATTGIAWDGDGLFVATSHAVEREDGLELTAEDGRRVEAELVGRDPRTDICLLRAELDRPSPKWTDTSSLAMGHLAVTVAPGRVSLTTIASVSNDWVAPTGGRIARRISIDTRRFLGLSGSALVGPDGSALGMNTTGLSRRQSLTLPTETLRMVVSDLLEHGQIRRAFLGITTSSVALPSSVPVSGDAQRAGLLVLSVLEGSPAAKAGLFLGDVLLGIDDEPIDNPMTLLAYLTGDRIDHEAQARILRAGNVLTVPIKVAAKD